jgi:undecaprenyl-diphosphatase
MELDHWLRLLVVTHRLHWLNPVMWAVSVIGRAGIVWVAAGLALTLARRLPPRGLVQLALAILLASLVTNQLLKPLIGRERPFVRTPDIHVIGGRPGDPSFPSGHSANAFAGAYVLSRIVPAAQVVWWTMALAIAYSRVYLGVHYPLDVIGGAIVGMLCAFLVCRVATQMQPRRELP